MNYAYWLANVPGIGSRTAYRLISQAGSAEELYHLKERQLEKLSGLGDAEIRNILESKRSDPERAYEKMLGRGISFVAAEDKEFPERLRRLADPPYALYVKGRLPDENKKTAAIVGARMCSEYGHAAARELARRFAGCGVEVISGMAKGIDSRGHQGALEGGGSTYAVLGCGPDICYPASGRQLYEQIQKKGGIISEYAPGIQPKPGFFPCRNRIISGLSDVVVIVEAKARSGSLITADCALEQGKDVYAFPGRIYDTQSAGCNALIRQGAGIISDIGEFLEELGFCVSEENSQKNFKNLLLEKEERLVYSCVDLRPKSMEELLHQTGLKLPELAEILTGLVQKELIMETFKNYYARRI